jgi:hypothetical protein
LAVGSLVAAAHEDDVAKRPRWHALRCAMCNPRCANTQLTRKGGYRDRVAIPPAVGDAIDKMLAQRGNPETGLLFLTERGRRG